MTISLCYLRETQQEGNLFCAGRWGSEVLVKVKRPLQNRV